MAISCQQALRRRLMGKYQTLTLEWDENGSSAKAYIRINGRKYAKDMVVSIPRGAEVLVYVTANYNTNSYIKFNGVEVQGDFLNVAHAYTFRATGDAKIKIQYNEGIDYYKADITML